MCIHIYIYIHTLSLYNYTIIIIQLYIIHFACILYTVYTLAVCLCHSPGNISPKVSFSKRTPSPSPSSSNLCCFISQHKEILHRAIAVAPAHLPAALLNRKGGNLPAARPGALVSPVAQVVLADVLGPGPADRPHSALISLPAGRDQHQEVEMPHAVVTRIPWTQDIHRNVHFYRYVCVCVNLSIYVSNLI